jgi:hypothetical protein
MGHLRDYEGINKLEENLGTAKEKELERLKKQNLATIKEVSHALSTDNDIHPLIRQIPTHPWVKVVKGAK